MFIYFLILQESGKMELVLKPFNLRQCIEEIIDLVLLRPCTGKPNSQIDVVYILSPGKLSSFSFCGSSPLTIL